MLSFDDLVGTRADFGGHDPDVNGPAGGLDLSSLNRTGRDISDLDQQADEPRVRNGFTRELELLGW